MNLENNEKSRDLFCYGTALATGLLAGCVDFNNNEPQAAALVLLVMCGLMGLAWPRQAWRWGVIAPLGIPVVCLAGRALGFREADPIHPNIFASLLALIPGLIGVYAGVFVRWCCGNAVTLKRD